MSAPQQTQQKQEMTVIDLLVETLRQETVILQNMSVALVKLNNMADYIVTSINAANSQPTTTEQSELTNQTTNIQS
jgi:hypothetical protein